MIHPQRARISRVRAGLAAALAVAAVAGGCGEDATTRVVQRLAALRDNPDVPARERLTEEILADERIPVMVIGESAVAVGLSAERSTRGGDPAGLVVRNPGSETVTPGLRLVSDAPAGAYPLEVVVDDGEEARRLVFEGDGTVRIRLAPVAARSARLFIVWLESAPAAAEGDDRAARVRLLPPDAEALRLWAEQDVAAELEELRGQRGAKAWEDWAERLASRDGVRILPLRGQRLKVVGTTPDYWTRGTGPAALLATNPNNGPIRRSVRVACQAPLEHFPVTVFIDDAREIRSFVLDSPATLRLPLPEIPARSSRVFLLWTDKSWSPGKGDSRSLGVRLPPSAAGESS